VLEDGPAFGFSSRPGQGQPCGAELFERGGLSEGFVELDVAQAFDGQAAELPLPSGFFGLARAQVVVDGDAAERGVDAAGEVIAVARQETGRALLLGGRGLSDRGVQAAEVAAGPLAGRGGGELGELDQGGRTALRGHVPVMGAGDVFQRGAPALLKVGAEILIGPGTAMAGDDVAHPLEAFPTAAAVIAHGQAERADGRVHRELLAVPDDRLLRPQMPFSSTQFLEQVLRDGAAGGSQRGEGAAVAVGHTGQRGAGVGAFAHEPGGERDAVPELQGGAEGFGHQLVGVWVTDDAPGVPLQGHRLPQPVHLLVDGGGQHLPVQLLGEDVLVRPEAHDAVIDESPQRPHAGPLDGVRLVEGRPPLAQRRICPPGGARLLLGVSTRAHLPAPCVSALAEAVGKVVFASGLTNFFGIR
jgi:hypothetical protein